MTTSTPMVIINRLNGGTPMKLPLVQAIDVQDSFRNQVVYTLGGAYFDTLGPGLSGFTLTVNTGQGKSPIDGKTGQQRYDDLLQMLLLDYANALANTAPPTNEYIEIRLPDGAHYYCILSDISRSQQVGSTLPGAHVVGIRGTIAVDVNHQAAAPLPQFGSGAVAGYTGLSGGGEVQIYPGGPTYPVNTGSSGSGAHP